MKNQKLAKKHEKPIYQRKKSLMARTKQEVISFLNSQVGKSVNTKAGRLQGQCVSLIKALFEFLGVPDPYASRGNAKDAGNIYLAQNIAERGKGELTVCINKDMGIVNGIRYGHIWVYVKDGANYEQNGATALRVTKNTRPTSQGQQFVNLDKWIKKSATIDDMVKPTASEVKKRFNDHLGYAPTAKQIKHYTSTDKRTLFQDILNTGVKLPKKPTATDVKRLFKDELNLTPTQKQIDHYTSRNITTLYEDILKAK